MKISSTLSFIFIIAEELALKGIKRLIANSIRIFTQSLTPHIKAPTDNPCQLLRNSRNLL